MPIELKENNKGRKYYAYVPLSAEISFQQYSKWVEIFWRYIDANGISRSLVKINTPVLGELITRVDKRKEYFIVFHDDTSISDIKESALVAYWILKFKPFFIFNDDPTDNKNNLRINEGFAAYIIFCALKAHAKTYSLNFAISEEYKNRMMYSLKYWDLSKESVMILAETLCEQLQPLKGDENV